MAFWLYPDNLWGTWPEASETWLQRLVRWLVS